MTVKYQIIRGLLDALEMSSVPCVVLHGMEKAPEHVGRDVDVMISMKHWPIVSKHCHSIAKKLDLDVSEINSFAGLRFVFYARPDQCGTIEFHCLRSLCWFALPSPSELEAMSPFKRVLMPLLTGDVPKVERELDYAPLTTQEQSAVSRFITSVSFPFRGVAETFWRLIAERKTDLASSFLRRRLVAACFFRLHWLLRFICRRTRTFFWWFTTPCGPVVLVEDRNTAVSVKKELESKPGVLTRILIKDCSGRSGLRLWWKMLWIRHQQGRQQCQIMVCAKKVVSAKACWRKLLAEPVLLTDINGGVSAAEALCAAAMRKMTRVYSYPHAENQCVTETKLNQ